MMVFRGDAGTNKFEIYEDDLFSLGTIGDDGIKTGANAIVPHEITSDKSTGSWIITEADFNLGGTGNDASFYFLINGKESAILSVSRVDSGNENEIPVESITGPENGAIYFVDQSVLFSQSSYDPDDLINYLWDFGDGTIVEGTQKDGTSSNYNTQHVFTSAGQKIISLNVSDGRGGFADTKVSILVLPKDGNSQSVFAFIKTPAWGENIQGSIVNFDATGSYGVGQNCVSGSCTVTCLSGGCPDSVTIGNQNIADPNGKKDNYDDITFKWESDEGYISSAKGAAGLKPVIVFATPRTHSASLIIDLP